MEVVAVSSTNSGAGIDAMTNAALNSGAGIEVMTSAAANSGGSIEAMSGSAAGSASAISGLGSAASSAIGALMSAASSAGSAIMGAIGSAASAVGNAIGIGGHAEGGIFARGAHLTWFAERSAEAAIPLDGSQRSIDLWRTTGEMLGIMPRTGRQMPEVPRRKAQSLFGGNPLLELIKQMEWPGQPMQRGRSEPGQLAEAISSLAATDAEAGQMPEMLPPLELHYHFEGNVDREEVKRGVKESLPELRETFEEQLQRYRHEAARRSF